MSDSKGATWDKEAVRTAKEKVRTRLLETRTRLDELFYDFDKHHSKKVSPAQAKRAFDRLGARLSDEEEAAVLTRWGAADGSFLYDEFAEFMDKVFVRKGLEHNPDAKLSNPFEGRVLHTFGGKLDEAEEDELRRVLKLCEDQTSSRGLIVKDFFSSFDKRNNGYVTVSQFKRGFYNGFPTISDAETELIIKHYTDGLDVNYRALHLDCTPEAVAPGRVSFKAPTVGLPKRELTMGGDDPVDAIEDRLIVQVKSKRIRVAEFFKDFDRMRTGHCTRDQFLRVLINCKFAELPEGDMQLLADKYYNKDRGQVRYVDFTEEMDAAFTAAGLEKHPTATLDSRAFAVASGPRRPVPPMSDAEKAALDAGMHMITGEIVKRNFEMKPFFKDFDRSNEECVTRPQFLRVLKQLGCMPPTAQLNAILKRYPGPGAKATSHVDWRTFYQHVEPPDRFEMDQINAEAARTLTSLGAPLVRPAAAPRDMSVDLEKVLHQVKLQARKSQVRADEFFRDYDKLRRGYVTRAQFATGLSNSVIRLEAHEVAALADAYIDVRAKDSAGESMVNWRSFTDDVDSIWTRKGIESKPDADVDGETKEALYRTDTLRGNPHAGRGASMAAAGAGSRLTPEEEEAVRAILTDLDNAVKTRRLELPTHFREFDRHNTGVLPLDNFNRSLDRVGLALDGDALAVVGKAFRVPARDRHDVNYRWFYRALDDIDGVLGNLPEEDAAPTVSIALLEGKTRVTRKMPERTVRTLATSAADARAAEEALRIKCAKRRIRLKEFLADYDKLRLGRITKAKFRTALAAAGLDLTSSQLNALEAAYKHDADPNVLRWRDLAFIIDGGDEALERDPTKTVTKFQAPVYGVADTGVDSTALGHALHELQTFISQHNTLIKPTFQGFDRLRKNYVTRAQFASVLATLKLPASPRDVAVLCDAYAVHGTRDLVNYHTFLRAVDPTEI